MSKELLKIKDFFSKNNLSQLNDELESFYNKVKKDLKKSELSVQLIVLLEKDILDRETPDVNQQLATCHEKGDLIGIGQILFQQFDGMDLHQALQMYHLKNIVGPSMKKNNA